MGLLGTKGLRLVAICLCLSVLLKPAAALALDKRLERPLIVMGKTSALGAGAGLLAGGVALAFFDGGARTFGKCASFGLYGGIIFGLVVLLAPTEMFYGDPKGEPRHKPRAPRRWPNDSGDDDGWEESRYNPAHGFDQPQRVSAWVPVLDRSF